MGPRLSSLAVLSVALAAAVTAVTSADVPATAASPGRAAGPGAGARVAAAGIAGRADGAPASRPVVLINGGRVLVATGLNGGRAAVVIPAAGTRRPAAVASFTLGGRSYLAAATALRSAAMARAASAAAARPTRPGTPAYKLTVSGSDLAGKPDTGGKVFVYNVDDSNRFSGGNVFSHGTAAFTVPAGHYWAVAIFMEGSGHRLTQLRVVIAPQFTVSGNTSLHMAERSANSKVAVSTPRPAAAVNSTFEIRRPGAAGPVQYWEFQTTGISLWVSPSHRVPTVGTLQTFTTQQLFSPPGASRYEYNLAYAGPGGIIPRQHHVARPSGLATVEANYYQDLPSSGAETRFGLFPPQLPDLLLEPITPFSLPRHQTEYATGNPAISWFDVIQQCYPSTPCAGGQSDAVRSFRAGQRTRENWNAYPLHPGYNVNLTGAANPAATLPSASRAGNRLTLEVTPFSDNQPGHTGYGFSAGHYQIDQNGVKIAAGNAVKAADGNPSLALRVKLNARPARIRFVLTAARNRSSYPLSPRTRTVWAWRSVPRPQAVLPPGWRCRAQGSGPTARRCAVQPMLTLRYAITGLSLNGTGMAGQQHITITAGHLQLAGATRIRRVRAWVSLDDGKNWRPARMTRRGAGRYSAAFTAPAGAYVTLRASAIDAAGGSITETIDRAYRITS